MTDLPFKYVLFVDEAGVGISSGEYHAPSDAVSASFTYRGTGQAVGEVLELARQPKRWWERRPRYVPTGRVWCGERLSNRWEWDSL